MRPSDALKRWYRRHHREETTMSTQPDDREHVDVPDDDELEPGTEPEPEGPQDDGDNNDDDVEAD
jgi:hypothetical protein